MAKKIKVWIEAMRLRTLPVSVAGVLAGTACAVGDHGFRGLPALLCLLFAILAQIASNFANEYFDFRNGLDRKGREGFRRGVTEGDISPQAMLRATAGTLLLACAVGCCLIPYGGFWLIAIGAAVALFAIGYSAGPYPLSHHGLGDIAVVIFFGFVPVCLTAWLQTGSTHVLATALPISLSVGLLAAMVLMVNNYRDLEDDREAGKHTTAVIFGRKALSTIYMASGAVAVTTALCVLIPRAPLLVSCLGILFYPLYIILYRRLRSSRGRALNPLLGITAMSLLLFSLYLFASFSAAA